MVARNRYAYYASIAQYFHVEKKYGTRSGFHPTRPDATYAPGTSRRATCPSSAEIQGGRQETRRSGQVTRARTRRRDSRNAARNDGDTTHGRERVSREMRAAHPPSRPSDVHTRPTLFLLGIDESLYRAYLSTCSRVPPRTHGRREKERERERDG